MAKESDAAAEQSTDIAPSICDESVTAAFAAIFGESVKGLKPNSFETYKEGFKNVLDKEEAFYALDPEKAAILQELVDKHEFGK